ncbi:MAG: hypothetical protein NC124_13465 [Clostridium sp.]|nr:hypothetical protein [Ruminococcus flavefaciens]MCM1499470.1 hypothetical protein [Clostridium sp.]
MSPASCVKIQICKSDRAFWKVIITIIIFTIVQDLFCAFLLKIGVSVFSLKCVFYLKEAIILALGAYCFLDLLLKSNFHIKITECLVIIFLAVILIYIIIGTFRNGIYGSLLGSRQYIIPMMMLFIGIHIGKSLFTFNNYFIKFKNLVKNFSVFLIITTLIERFLVPVSFWEWIDMNLFSYWVKRGILTYVGKNDLIQNFYTADSRRAVGVAGEPLLLAYYMIPLFWMLLIFALFLPNKRERQKCGGLTIGIFLCQIFTLTRAIIICELTVIAFITLFIALRLRKIYKPKLILTILLCGCIFVVAYWDKIYSLIYKTLNNLDGGSAGMHLHQLKIGLSYVMKFWYGLGSGTGSNMVAFTGIKNLTTEFAYSNLIVDLGMIGCILYISIALHCFSIFFKHGFSAPNSPLRIMSIANALIIITWLLTGIFSPQMWGMKSVLFTWLSIGINCGMIDNKSWHCTKQYQRAHNLSTIYTATNLHK